MTTPLIVVGAGGFGREVLDLIDAVNGASDEPVFELLGVIDSTPIGPNIDLLAKRNVKYLGDETQWFSGGQSAQYVIGIGDPHVRQAVDERFLDAGFSPATIVHPQSLLGSGCVVGAGSVICAGAIVATEVTLGRHVHLNPRATVGHDSILGNYVSVNPSATISGNVKVGDNTLIGAASVILQGLTVGDHSVIGAAACVVRDVPSATTVKGVPAR